MKYRLLKTLPRTGGKTEYHFQTETGRFNIITAENEAAAAAALLKLHGASDPQAQRTTQFKNNNLLDLLLGASDPQAQRTAPHRFPPHVYRA